MFENKAVRFSNFFSVENIVITGSEDFKINFPSRDVKSTTREVFVEL